MPSKNSLKEYVAESYYHIYNRGVEKRIIFQDDLDYQVFLSYFKVALSPDDADDDQIKQIDTALLPGSERLRRLRLHEEVELLAFCLLPNHFHLMLYQHSERGIQKLMQSVMTGYVMYFNKRNERVGGLFQGRYKASMIGNDAYLQHISRYIHLNTIDAGDRPETYEYSSYPFYLGKSQAKWMKPQRILKLFNNVQQYVDFVHDYEDYKRVLNQTKRQLAGID
ncbi:hypothetical protein BH23PAT1_BH23PAT1_1570 [soil metagenome]